MPVDALMKNDGGPRLAVFESSSHPLHGRNGFVLKLLSPPGRPLRVVPFCDRHGLMRQELRDLFERDARQKHLNGESIPEPSPVCPPGMALNRARRPTVKLSVSPRGSFQRGFLVFFPWLEFIPWSDKGIQGTVLHCLFPRVFRHVLPHQNLPLITRCLSAIVHKPGPPYEPGQESTTGPILTVNLPAHAPTVSPQLLGWHIFGSSQANCDRGPFEDETHCHHDVDS
jgi:hypothetical protein